VRDKSDEPFEAFGARVLDFCTMQNAQTLVIDLRNNSGGDNSIFGESIEKLRKSDEYARQTVRHYRPPHLFRSS